VIGSDGEMQALIVYRAATGSPLLRALSQLFEGLAAKDPRTLDDVPGLAESWDISPDARVFTFQLRQGVKFHDGTPFNAEVAKFVFDMNFDPAHPYYDQVGAGIAKPRFGTMEKVEVLGEYTLRVTHKQPFANFIVFLSDPPSFFISPSAVKKF